MEKPSAPQPYYRCLARKMFMTIITVPFIPVFLVSADIFHQFRTSYREKILAYLSEKEGNCSTLSGGSIGSSLWK